MRLTDSRPWLFLFLCLSFAGLIGCGGSGTTSGVTFKPTPTPTAGTQVAVAFQGSAPLAAAVRTGSVFSPAPLQDNQLIFLVPTGSKKYSIAYQCPQVISGFFRPFTVDVAYVNQATTDDNTSYKADCFYPSHATGLDTVTLSYDASAIPGAASIFCLDSTGFGGVTGKLPITGSSSLLAQRGVSGVGDFGLVVLDGSSNVLALKILRSQNVPGALNGGNPVVFAASDLLPTQPVTYTGGTGTRPGVRYHTAGGLEVPLTYEDFFFPFPQIYAVVPAAETQPGDVYRWETSAETTGPFPVSGGGSQTAMNWSGGPITIPIPPQWNYNGPAPAQFPTFTFDYSGFAGLPATAQQAEIEWGLDAIGDSVKVVVAATASFQNGANTITIPDVSFLSPTFAPPQSGANIHWIASILGGTAQQFPRALQYDFPGYAYQCLKTGAAEPCFTITPSTGTLSFVYNVGSYTKP